MREQIRRRETGSECQPSVNTCVYTTSTSWHVYTTSYMYEEKMA